MNLITLHKRITERLLNGEKREAIYLELSKNIQAGEEKKIALSIAAVAEPKVNKLLRPHNLILIGLLVAVGVLSLYLNTSQAAIEGIADIINALIPFIFIPFVSIFYGPSYRYIAIWALLELLQDALLVSESTAISPIQLAILVSLFTLFALAWFIARKAFAHLSLFGVRRDKEGNFLI